MSRSRRTNSSAGAVRCRRARRERAGPFSLSMRPSDRRSLEAAGVRSSHDGSPSRLAQRLRGARRGSAPAVRQLRSPAFHRYLSLEQGNSAVSSDVVAEWGQGGRTIFSTGRRRQRHDARASRSTLPATGRPRARGARSTSAGSRRQGRRALVGDGPAGDAAATRAARPTPTLTPVHRCHSRGVMSPTAGGASVCAYPGRP